jgi:dienelactone hydrolase
MASGKDAENLKIPFACFASKDEPADEIAAMEKHVKANSAIADKSVFKTYDTMKHGFAAARGDVSDPQVKKEYESLYASVVSFFSQTL